MGQRIMAIDAAPEILDLYDQVLTAEGYEVHLCPAGAGTYAQVCALMPDAIILDTHLPAPLSSAQMLALLTDDARMRHIPIILSSTQRRLLQEPNDGHTPRWEAALEKPFDLEMLLSAVSSVLWAGPQQKAAHQPSAAAEAHWADGAPHEEALCLSAPTAY